MTKLVQSAAIVATLALSLISQPTFAQKDQKIAIVDVNAVVSAMPEYTAATQKVTALQNAYGDTIKQMQAKLQNTQETYSKLGETVTADAKKKEQDELNAQDQAMRAYYDSKFGAQGEIAQTQQNLLKPIQEKIKNALTGFAKKEHISMIVPANNVVYFDPALDQTTKFQDYMKANP